MRDCDLIPMMKTCQMRVHPDLLLPHFYSFSIVVRNNSFCFPFIQVFSFSSSRDTLKSFDGNGICGGEGADTYVNEGFKNLRYAQTLKHANFIEYELVWKLGFDRGTTGSAIRVWCIHGKEILGWSDACRFAWGGPGRHDYYQDRRS